MDKKKTIIVGGLVAGGLLLAALASAKDPVEPDPGEPDPGEPDPVDPGEPDPVDPGPGRADPDPVEPPPPPNPLIKDYVGSGYNWPRKDIFPNEKSFGRILANLGYWNNPDAPNWNVISGAFMSLVRDFQSYFNVIRIRPAVSVGAPKALVPDGLIGKNTINALIAAAQWQDQHGPWLTLGASLPV